MSETQAALEQSNETLEETRRVLQVSNEHVDELAQRLDALSSITTRPTLPVEHRVAQVADIDFAERVITFIAVPWNEETVVPGPDGEPIRERFERGAFSGIETRSPDNPVTINRDHDPHRVVGKAIAFNTEDERGLVVEAHISRTPLGDETLQLAADQVLRASVGFAARRSDAPIRNGLRSVKRAFLDHIGMLPNPAYAGATVLAVREQEVIQATATPTPNLDAVLEMLGGDKP